MICVDNRNKSFSWGVEEQFNYNKAQYLSDKGIVSRCVYIIICRDTSKGYLSYASFFCKPRTLEKTLKAIYHNNIWYDVVGVFDVRMPFKMAEVKNWKK